MTIEDETQRDLAPGEARCPGPGVQDFYALDHNPPPPGLMAEHYVYAGSEPLAPERYTSLEFHEREIEKVWRKVWQVACREEDVARVGDTSVYDIGDDSILVVRAEDGRLRAFWNSCLHRGTALRTEPGNVAELRCPFHGFCWSLEGRSTEIVCEWDFPHIEPDEFNLPEVRLDTWGGFVFICMSDDAPSLVDFLGPLPKYFDPFPLEHRHTVAHVVKVMPANWKVALEAFLESFHVIRTHPQVLSYVGDANSQYDNFGSAFNFNRMISLKAIPSPHVAAFTSPEDTLQTARETYGWEGEIVLAEGVTVRQELARAAREELADRTGLDLSNSADSDILDTLQYYLFPNFVPWAGVGLPLIYRFLPNGHDPDSSLMEVWVLQAHEPGSDFPAPAPLRRLSLDEDWTKAPELGGLGPVFNQDSFNMPRVQKGLKTMRGKGVMLANYQESRIRHLHGLLDKYLES
jgi:phenylpropionate dioxygenase-like ring-hydroxylating dioxygenase large terminal subunit